MILDLTIAIPVKNEASNLPDCLNAIGKNLSTNVVLIDSGSTDGTRQLAREWGAEIFDFNWDGKYPKKRNWFLLNHTPQTEWVLFLDADEILSEDFKNELRNTLPHTSMNGFWLNYSIYFMGKTLRGGYPLQKLALFRIGKGLYERIDEDNWSQLDMEIHEHPIIDGPIGKIKSHIDHIDDRGIEHYKSKHEAYAKWEASRFINAKNNPTIRKTWTWKQRIKYILMGTPFSGLVFFIGSYFLLRGFIDGQRGFKFSLLKMRYFNQVYRNIQQLKVK